MNYRIYLSLCGADAGGAALLPQTLVQRTHRSADLYVAGPQSALDRLRQIEGPAPCGMLPMPENASHEACFAAVVRESGGEWDFIFLTGGVAVPDLWDLRLAWTAERAGGVATVSPINESSRWTRLGMTPSADVDIADRACYRSSALRNPEIPEFLPDCVYVRREAVCAVLAMGAAPNTFREFGDACGRLRWPHVLADHIYTTAAKKTARPSDPVAPVNGLVAGTPGTQLKSIREYARGRLLHILHSWGGGLERWVAEYCRADSSRTNLILKSVGNWGAFGEGLRLFRNIEDSSPIRQWALSPAVKHTAVNHCGYRAALAEIVDRYAIDHILVSSLIGHSLDALDAGVPVTLIAHDYYPFCPALNITFGAVCRRCAEADLRNCTQANVHHRFFRNVPPFEWLELRKAFSRRILGGNLRIVAPSPSVPRNYAELAPELKDCFELIPHGVRTHETGPLRLDHSAGKRLRIVVLGSLAPQKGLDLLKRIQPGLSSFADLFLVGCGEHGREFKAVPGVESIPEYEWRELPALLESIGPHAGLLLSVVPETFSYTLQEMMALAIPPVATRIGSFADFTEDGCDGFLCDPDAAAVLARLEELNANRGLLADVHRRLRSRRPRGPAEMVDDYEHRLGLPPLSARAYFAREEPAPNAAPATTGEPILFHLGNAEARVKELEASLSWRITAPLRWAGRRVLKWRGNA